MFADQVFIDPTFFGIFVCGPLQSFVVNVCNSVFAKNCRQTATERWTDIKGDIQGGI